MGDNGTAEKRQLSGAWVSEEAWNGWRDFVDHQGCGSLSAFLEAAGLYLAERAHADPDELGSGLRSLILESRRVHRERQRR